MKARWFLILLAIVLVPAIGFVGCDDDDDDDDDTPPAADAGDADDDADEGGLLQVTVVGALVIDAFDEVDIQVDGDGIGSVDWPDGGTINFPTTVGAHTVTAQANAGTRHWGPINVDVPDLDDGPVVVTLNAGNSEM
ncbi:MAG: hypothetical protein JXB04_02765 [Kiritimatiellae bacterium]|nr:hypothetical protein [Kiritimatiellia bacterium]